MNNVDSLIFIIVLNYNHECFLKQRLENVQLQKIR